MKTGAIIVAAGSGTRMGGGDKCALPLGDATILSYSVAAFAAVVDQVVVVVAPEQVATWEETARQEHWPSIDAIIGGGDSRQASVRAGFEALTAAGMVDVVAIHDGARPLVTPDVIHACIAAAETIGAAIAAVPVTDTIKRAVDQRVVETPDRSSLWAAQTPQAFRREVLAAAFAWAASSMRAPFTDEAGLVAAYGHPVGIVPGERSNIKVTEPTDQIVAAALLASRKGGDRA